MNKKKLISLKVAFSKYFSSRIISWETKNLNHELWSNRQQKLTGFYIVFFLFQMKWQLFFLICYCFVIEIKTKIVILLHIAVSTKIKNKRQRISLKLKELWNLKEKKKKVVCDNNKMDSQF